MPTGCLHLTVLGTGSEHLSTQLVGGRDRGSQGTLDSLMMSPCVSDVGLTSRQLFIMTK